MKQWLFTACLAVLLLTANVNAQVLNVEEVRNEADTTGWVGELGFDITLNKFNERVFKIGNEVNASYFSNKHGYLFLNSIEFISVDDASVISNGQFHFRTTFLRKHALSPELFIQYQYNDNLGLTNRALSGAGVRYRFLDRKNINGHASTGFMAEYEEWGLSGEETTENTFLKSTSNIVVRGNINPNTSLLLVGYYQARPDRFFKPRVISENKLNIKVNRNVALRISFTMSYDVEPIIDIPNFTYELKNGIIITL